jgi:hypothetical protein
MNKVKEALKSAIEEINDLVTHIRDREPTTLFSSAEIVLSQCKSALSDIEKREPVAYCNSEQLADMKLKRQSCNVWHKKYDGCDVELYTSPISKEREGWVSVPIKPTELQMREACKSMGEILSLNKIDTADITGWMGTYKLAEYAYKAMLSSAPKE